MSTEKLAVLTAALALASFSVMAQQGTTDESTAVYQTPQGQLTVHSSQPGARSYAPPPPFNELSHGKAFITSEDAAGYDLLANDFLYADSNHDGRISRAEYDRWVRSR